MKDSTSLVDKTRKHECTCAQTNTGKASKCRDLPWSKSFHGYDPTCWCIVTFIHDAESQVIMMGNDETRCGVYNCCRVQQTVASPILIQKVTVQSPIIRQGNPGWIAWWFIKHKIPLSPTNAFRTSWRNVDDRKITDSAATVGKASLLMGAIGSKSGRRESASATKFRRLGLFFTERFHSANKTALLHSMIELWTAYDHP